MPIAIKPWLTKASLLSYFTSFICLFGNSYEITKSKLAQNLKLFKGSRGTQEPFYFYANDNVDDEDDDDDDGDYDAI